jgi:hypothetical protein
MPRYFTRDEAERTLPSVEEAIRELLFLRAEHEKTEQALKEVGRKLMLSGGMLVDIDHVKGLRTARENSARLLEERFEQIQSFGCLVKDLSIGLLDFPTLYRNEEVYLCWRLGETRIEFWHGVDEGFRGRKPIDQDFLDNHRGDLVS